jgi:hypothetical protein
MGINVAVPVANLMCHFWINLVHEKLCEKFNCEPLLTRNFLDDVFVILPSKLSNKLDAVHRILNEILPSISTTECVVFYCRFSRPNGVLR